MTDVRKKDAIIQVFRVSKHDARDPNMDRDGEKDRNR